MSYDVKIILFLFLQFISLRIIYSGMKSIFELKKLSKTEIIKWDSYIFPLIIILGGVFYTFWHIYLMIK